MTGNRPDAPAPHLKGGCGERSTFGRSQESTEEHPRSEEHPEPYSDQEWAGRLRAAVEATLARRRRRQTDQAEFKRRREHGLRARHQAKLARADQRLREATEQGIHDSWFEEDQ